MDHFSYSAHLQMRKQRGQDHEIAQDLSRGQFRLQYQSCSLGRQLAVTK